MSNTAEKPIGEYRRMAEYWKKEFNSQVHKCNAIQMELNKAKEEIDRLKGQRFCLMHAKELDKFGRCSVCDNLLYVSK